jgi:hypothetical protein
MDADDEHVRGALFVCNIVGLLGLHEGVYLFVPFSIIFRYLRLLFFNMSSIVVFVSEKEDFFCRSFPLPALQLIEKNAG